MYRIIAIVPARSGSKGLENKNIRKLGDTHLIGYPIRAALESKMITTVVFSSDSKEYLEIAKIYEPHVLDLRPEKLASDTAKRSDLILYLLDKYEGYDLVVYLEPTSPFTTSEDIDRAINKLLKSNDFGRSIVGVCSSDTHHPKYALKMSDSGVIKPYFLDSFKDLPINRQELDDVYFFDGSFYISFVDTFRHEGEFYHSKTLGLELESYKSLEIDKEIDFKVAEVIRNENKH